MESLTIQEFIRKFRPQGYGIISVGDEQQQNIIKFQEIICDSCNAEITQLKEDLNKKMVFVVDTDAYCEECFEKYFKGKVEETLSLTDKAKEFLNKGINYVNFVYTNGHKEKRRLFKSQDNEICVIGKGRKNKGHYVSDEYNLKDIQEITKKVTELQSWERKIDKAIKLLEKSGLWKDVLENLKLTKKIGYNKVQECYKLTNAEFKEGYYENQVERVNKIKEIEPRLIKINKETGKEYYNTSILWYLVYPLKIKKMNFGRYSNKDKLKLIKKAMQKKQKILESGRTSYDVSFEYNPEKNMAWYSEEYRNCGNGHYYLALNEEYAMFEEDD